MLQPISRSWCKAVDPGRYFGALGRTVGGRIASRGTNLGSRVSGVMFLNRNRGGWPPAWAGREVSQRCGKKSTQQDRIDDTPIERGETLKLRGAFIATAALSLLAAGPSVAVADSGEGGQVKCSGINGCSGKGECAAADGSHGCSGKNSCAGKGWVHTDSEEACTEKGGNVSK